MQSYPSGYDPEGYVRHVGVVIEFLDDNKGLSISQDEIISLVIKEGLDITCDTFPSRTLKFKAVDSIGLAFAYSRTDYTRSRIKVLIDVEGSEINGGIFYITSISTSDIGLTVDVTASDLVDYMDKYMTGLYISSPVSMSALIKTPSGALEGIDVSCDETTLGYTVYPQMMDTVDTQRSCLLKLAQAAGMASVWVDRNEVVHMERVAGRDGVNAAYLTDFVLDYSSISLKDHTDFVQITGENDSGSFSATCGKYTRGCLTEFLKNDFIYSSVASIVASRYYESKNQRFEATIKTRCNPVIEPNDLVLVGLPHNRDLGVFILTSQTITYDKGGLVSTAVLNSPSPTDE